MNSTVKRIHLKFKSTYGLKQPRFFFRVCIVSFAYRIVWFEKHTLTLANSSKKSRQAKEKGSNYVNN